MKIRFMSVLALAGLLATSVFAAGELGDPAAPLQIDTWVKGKPVDLAAAKGKQIVVVEFWATWCPPCRASIPHLTELQKKFKDVIFVGVTDEELPTVKKFVDKMGDKMDYVVAVDKDSGTSKAYMHAYGIDGIPHAFIVNKEGLVVWHGHPMGNLEKSLEEIVSGKFDLTMAKKRALAEQKMEEFFAAAQQSEDRAAVEKLGKELEALDAELGGIEPGKPFKADEVLKMIKFQSLLKDYQRAISKGKTGEPLEKLEKEIQDSAPKDFDLAEYREMVQASKVFSDYMRVATGRGDAAKLPELTKQMNELKIKNPRALNEYAWTLLTNENIEKRDLELATKFAKAAVDASEAKDPGILDTYARALYDSGKTEEAVTWQKKAISASDDDEERKQLQEALEKYQAKKKE